MSDAIFQIEIEDHVSELLTRLGARLADPTPLMQAAADALALELQHHFMIRDEQTPNQEGWPRSGFWGQFVEATDVASVSSDGADVAISHSAILQKLYGGTIEPKRGQYLALPAMAAAYAAGSPREGATPDLMYHLAPHPDGGWRPALVAFTAGTKMVKDPRKGHKGEYREVRDVKKPAGVWYWLVRSVTQAADPLTIPPSEQLTDAVLTAITRDIDVIMTEANAA